MTPLWLTWFCSVNARHRETRRPHPVNPHRHRVSPGRPARRQGRAFGAPLKQSGRTLKLIGVVTKVRSQRVEKGIAVHSTVELLSGSKNVRKLANKACSALAIHF